MTDLNPYSELADLAARFELAVSPTELLRLDSELHALDDRLRVARKRLYAAQVEVEYLRRNTLRALMGHTITAIARR